MTMMQYILTRQSGSTRARASTPDQIRQLPEVHVLDQTGDRVLLLEAEPEVFDRHRKRIRGWTISPVVVYAAPWDSNAPF
jgi:hypothetical protein